MPIPVHLIKNELASFEDRFKNAVKSNTPLLNTILRYIVKRKGKQLRPMFVFLSAKLYGPTTEATYRAASLVEILHTGTLVHDDVVDDSLERRGFFSVYALWKNKASVLVGDYLFATGLSLSLQHNDYRTLKIMSDTIQKMAEGELLQLEKARNLNISEDIYYDIIRNKTASLLASACSSGTWSVTENEELTENMRQFGENTGIAFQIKDDLFDYASEDVGKPTGNDIKEKKLTLPLIYTLNNTDKGTRKAIINIVKNNNNDKKKVAWVLETVKTTGGIEYATKKMIEFKKNALDILSRCPNNEYQKGLQDLVEYVTERRY